MKFEDDENTKNWLFDTNNDVGILYKYKQQAMTNAKYYVYTFYIM